MTEQETEELIYETAAGAARKFLQEDRANDPLLPPGSIEDAVRRRVVYIGGIALAFEEALRSLIPYDHEPETFVPVIEGEVLSFEIVR